MDAVKFVADSEDRIEGLAIPFGGPAGGKDLQGETFTKDTDLALDWFPEGRQCSTITEPTPIRRRTGDRATDNGKDPRRRRVG